MLGPFWHFLRQRSFITGLPPIAAPQLQPLITGLASPALPRSPPRSQFVSLPDASRPPQQGPSPRGGSGGRQLPVLSLAPRRSLSAIGQPSWKSTGSLRSPQETPWPPRPLRKHRTQKPGMSSMPLSSFSEKPSPFEVPILINTFVFLLGKTVPLATTAF